MRENCGERAELEQRGRDEPDLPPEYCHYHDEGCELSSSCLRCPFRQCIYDEPGGRQRWLKQVRDREILNLYTNGPKGVRELALLFGVSIRTVQRALKTSPGNTKGNNRMEVPFSNE